MVPHRLVLWSWPTSVSLALRWIKTSISCAINAARVTDLYRSPDFRRSCGRSPKHPRACARSCGRCARRVPAWQWFSPWSVFEAGEGRARWPLGAFSHHMGGLFEGVTAALVEYWCRQSRVFARQVRDPDPFGPVRVAALSAPSVNQTLRCGKAAEVRTPPLCARQYPFRLLSKAYAGQFVRQPPVVGGLLPGPSERLRRESGRSRSALPRIGPRPGPDAGVTCWNRRIFSEPLVSHQYPAGRLHGTWMVRGHCLGQIADFYRPL